MHGEYLAARNPFTPLENYWWVFVFYKQCTLFSFHILWALILRQIYNSSGSDIVTFTSDNQTDRDFISPSCPYQGIICLIKLPKRLTHAHGNKQIDPFIEISIPGDEADYRTYMWGDHSRHNFETGMMIVKIESFAFKVGISVLLYYKLAFYMANMNLVVLEFIHEQKYKYMYIILVS